MGAVKVLEVKVPGALADPIKLTQAVTNHPEAKKELFRVIVQSPARHCAMDAEGVMLLVSSADAEIVITDLKRRLNGRNVLVTKQPATDLAA